MNVEELKARLQAEFSRREIFERKNADLEAINEKLRTENDVRVWPGVGFWERGREGGRVLYRVCMI